MFSFIRSKSAVRFLIVVLVWGVLLIAPLSLVRRYGTRTLPQNDEVWALYEAGPGIHLGWLWKTWAEHRIPLAKLIWKAVLELTDYDFRTGNFLTVLALATLALAMIWTARKIRGRTIIADAFFHWQYSISDKHKCGCGGGRSTMFWRRLRQPCCCRSLCFMEMICNPVTRV